MAKPTGVDNFLTECDMGVFKEKLAITLSECALGTLHNAKPKQTGKVTVEITFSRIGETDQVIVGHKLSHSTPTGRGKKSEENLTETPMYVSPSGQLSVNFQEDDKKTQLSLAQ